MSDEFRQRLISHAEQIIERAQRAQSEAATQQYLILPFFQLLGYDPLNPDEVVPEAHASFSEKFRNRVDYAICQESEPVIAVECKIAGTALEQKRGELKGYFNAVPSVKLGILTDGVVYELYSDTGRENMMDDEPFARIDLREVVDGGITDNALDALIKLRKGTFDPADVGADARRKIYIASYVDTLEQNFKSPDERIVRTLMDLADVEGRRTSRLLEEHAELVRESIQVFLDKKILERVGFADREDLVRMKPAAPSPAAENGGEEVGEEVVAPQDAGILTTDTEREVFDYVRTRLSFLIDDEDLFRKLDDLAWTDFKTTFIVYYKQQRNGRIFNFCEGGGPRYRFDFPDVDETVVTDDLREIDDALLRTFRRRVEELG